MNASRSELIFVTDITVYTYLWRKDCHVEKFQLSMYDNCGKTENFSTCGEILGNFATIYALSWGEKLSPKSTFVEKK